MRNHCKVAQRQISMRIWVGGGAQIIWKHYRICSYRGEGGGGGGGNSKAYRGGGGQKVVNLDVILSGPQWRLYQHHMYEFYLLVQFRF